MLCYLHAFGILQVPDGFQMKHPCLEVLDLCRGRKKAALTYAITYIIGCATKHWDVFGVLLVGRLFCGIATSLLYSAFESWLVAEHFKVQSQKNTLMYCHPQSGASTIFVCILLFQIC